MLPRELLQHFGLMPEWLEEDIGEMESAVEMLLTDPGNALEAMVQSLSDTADEKGMAYSVSYAVVDMVTLDKLLGKLGKLGKVEDVAGTATTMEKITDAADVGKSLDAVGEVTETAVKSSIEVVKDHVDEMGEVVIKEGTDVIYNHVDAVGEEMADDIILEMMLNPDNVQKQLVNISTDGNVTSNILDEYANVVK